MSQKKVCLSLFATTLAAATFATACQQPPPPPPPAQSQAQPAPVQNETVIYNKWEVETHRPHVEIERRPPAEQKEYQDWRAHHPDHR